MQIYKDIILSLFEGVMTLILIHGIVKPLKTNIISKLIYLVVSSILIALISKYINNDVFLHIVSTIVGFICLQLYLHRKRQKKYLDNTILFFFSYIMASVIQLITALMLSMIFKDFDRSFSYGLIAQVIAVALIFIISKTIKISVIQELIQQKYFGFQLITITLFNLQYGISIFWYMDESHITEQMIAVGSIVILTIIISGLILREGYFSKVYKEKLLVYDTYLPIIDDMVDEVRQKQHDMHNHLQTMVALSQSGQNETIQDYIQQIETNQEVSQLLKLNNKIVLAFLYSKYLSAQEKGINIIFDIHNYVIKSTLTDYELIELFSILIDNAMEAVEKQLVKKDIYIVIKVEKNPNFQTNLGTFQQFAGAKVHGNKYDNVNVFIVKNQCKQPTTNDMNQWFKKGYSTKAEKNRGIGLYKLKQMLQAKQGEVFVHYDYDNHLLVAEIHYL